MMWGRFKEARCETMENESIGQRRMGINYKGSQGQTKRTVVLEGEEDVFFLLLLEAK